MQVICPDGQVNQFDLPEIATLDPPDAIRAAGTRSQILFIGRLISPVKWPGPTRPSGR